VAGWAISEIGDIPQVPGGEAEDPDWYPLQHFFGLTTFGANVFRAVNGHETLVAEHDESSSGQQELYLVLEGEAEFELAGERIRAARGTAIAVTDPSVSRRAVACVPGTALLAVGAGEGPFNSTWRKSHFEKVPRAADR
jgi:hypothetical protein